MGAPKGRKAWNKGLTKDTDERIRKYGERGKKAKLGNRNASKYKIGEIWKLETYPYLLICTDGGRKDLHRYIWEEQNGKIPEGYVVHHKDRNRFNNKIENLEIMKLGKHGVLHNTGLHNKHSQETKNKISNTLIGHIVSEETKEKISKGLKKYYEV